MGGQTEGLLDLVAAPARLRVEQLEQTDMVRRPEKLKAERPAQRCEESVLALLQRAREESGRDAIGLLRPQRSVRKPAEIGKPLRPKGWSESGHVIIRLIPIICTARGPRGPP